MRYIALQIQNMIDVLTFASSSMSCIQLYSIVVTHIVHVKDNLKCKQIAADAVILKKIGWFLSVFVCSMNHFVHLKYKALFLKKWDFSQFQVVRFFLL